MAGCGNRGGDGGVIVALLILDGLSAIVGVTVLITWTQPPPVNAEADNDLTGSNPNFGKSLMGDDDELGKGL